jgi:hypothetical protein
VGAGEQHYETMLARAWRAVADAEEHAALWSRTQAERRLRRCRKIIEEAQLDLLATREVERRAGHQLTVDEMLADRRPPARRPPAG